MTEQIIGTTILLAGVALVLGLLIWHWRRSREICELWASNEGFELLSARRCLFWRGPFVWGTTKAQVVFRIVVRTSSQEQRSGYLRCGGAFRGVVTDAAEVSWDD